MDLKTLSSMLGLSQTTVSRALNGYSDVSERTRERVVEAARSHGYRPDPTARRLAVGRADAVGIVYHLGPDDLGDPFFIEVISGISETLDKREIDLIIASAPADEMRSFVRLVSGRRVDGLIVPRTRVVDPRIEMLQRVGFPFVAYGRTADPRKYAWLDIDNQVGLRLAVDRLASLGHERIALVSGPSELNFVAERRLGYLAGLRAAGLRADPARMITGQFSRRGGYQAMTELLRRRRRPTAVIVDNNLSAAGAVSALLDAKIEVGPEMSVIVYDGLPPDMLLAEEVTRVEQPDHHQVGGRLARMMLALLDGEKPNRLQVLLQPHLKIGKTDGPAPR
jgi:LacI family transcriptional regulator